MPNNNQPPSASDERKRFEAWAQNGFELHRAGGAEYSSAITQCAWAAWQARAALAPSPGVDAAEQKPCATLHDDGHWTWTGTPPYESSFAGWRMPVYAAPSPAASADEWMAEAENLVDLYADECYETARTGFIAKMVLARAALLAHLKARP